MHPFNTRSSTLVAPGSTAAALAAMPETDETVTLKEAFSYIDTVGAILLNKVAGLEWYYFSLDLPSITINQLSLDAEKFSLRELIDKVLKPVSCSNNHYSFERRPDTPDTATILTMLMRFIGHFPEVLIDVSKRIFDANSFVNKSESDEGALGTLNKWDRKSRNEDYDRKMRNGFRNSEKRVVILAEGDSWFEYPRVPLAGDPVRDIVDWLRDDEDYAVYSMAAGGDWLSNIFYRSEYVEELPLVAPDVFLISGGGNDLVGSGRLGNMVRAPFLEGKRPLTEEPIAGLVAQRTTNPDATFDQQKWLRGLALISDEFFQFVNICMLQYFLFFYKLWLAKSYQRMLVLTQGYDYALPSGERHGRLLSLQRLMNTVTDTGGWLHVPLNMKGITDEADQESVVYAMIHEFNEMQISLAKFFPNVIHIDCRGAARNGGDWYDELHLTSSAFERVGKTYRQCIKENLRLATGAQKDVYRVRDQR